MTSINVLQLTIFLFIQLLWYMYIMCTLSDGIHNLGDPLLALGKIALVKQSVFCLFLTINFYFLMFPSQPRYFWIQ